MDYTVEQYIIAIGRKAIQKRQMDNDIKEVVTMLAHYNQEKTKKSEQPKLVLPKLKRV